MDDQQPAEPALFGAPRGGLDDRQRSRSAAAYEAARMILGDDPEPEDIIMVADYIVTGRRPPASVKVLPDDSLVEQVCERVVRVAAARVDPDSASWTAGADLTFERGWLGQQVTSSKQDEVEEARRGG